MVKLEAWDKNSGFNGESNKIGIWFQLFGIPSSSWTNPTHLLIEHRNGKLMKIHHPALKTCKGFPRIYRLLSDSNLQFIDDFPIKEHVSNLSGHPRLRFESASQRGLGCPVDVSSPSHMVRIGFGPPPYIKVNIVSHMFLISILCMYAAYVSML